MEEPCPVCYQFQEIAEILNLLIQGMVSNFIVPEQAYQQLQQLLVKCKLQMQLRQLQVHCEHQPHLQQLEQLCSQVLFFKIGSSKLSFFNR